MSHKKTQTLIVFLKLICKDFFRIDTWSTKFKCIMTDYDLNIFLIHINKYMINLTQGGEK